MAKFWLQTKSKAGNWVDDLGVNREEDLQSLFEHGEWYDDQNYGYEWRVVSRVDTEIPKASRILRV